MLVLSKLIKIPVLHVESNKTFSSTCKCQVTDFNTHVHIEDMKVYYNMAGCT